MGRTAVRTTLSAFQKLKRKWQNIQKPNLKHMPEKGRTSLFTIQNVLEGSEINAMSQLRRWEKKGKRAGSSIQIPCNSSSPTSTGTGYLFSGKRGTKHFWITGHSTHSCQRDLTETGRIEWCWETQASSLI